MDTELVMGAKLALQCFELDKLARKASDLLLGELEKIVTIQELYRFTARLKGQENIQNKVLRKRDENDIAGRREKYNPENVTDAWGARIVTLFPSQILEAMSAIFQLIEKMDDEGHAISIEEIFIYNNRPSEDPLSISKKAVQLSQNYSNRYAHRKPVPVSPKASAKETGYSSVHIILSVPIRDFTPAVGADLPTNSVKVEIQVRDIFEEAWGQISHYITYNAKDRLYKVGEQSNITVEEISGPHLNALKAISDGCSQYAEQVRQNYVELHGRIPSATIQRQYVPLTNLEDDKQLILNSLKGISVSEKAIQSIHAAYGLIKDANDAAYKNIDRRIARNNFLGAAEQVELAVKALGDTAKVRIPGTGGKSIAWYMLIERANALYLSIPRAPEPLEGEARARYDAAMQLYRSLGDEHPDYDVIQFRKIQAEHRIVCTQQEIETSIERLNNILDNSDRPALVRNELFFCLVRIEKALIITELCDVIQDEERKTALLREAIVECIRAAETLHSDVTEYTKIAYWRAINNELWCYCKLSKTKAELQDEDRRRIKECIDELKSPTLWPTVKNTSATIENLMIGYDILGNKGEAIKAAKSNIELLEQAARQRGWKEEASASKFLEGDEKVIYEEARHFLEKNSCASGSINRSHGLTARDRDKLLARDVERDVFEIVLARAAHRDVLLCHAGWIAPGRWSRRY